MESIGEQISKLAQKYDPDREADGLASRALIQGAFVGAALHKMDFIKIQDVQQNLDANDDYEHHFVIVTGSGHRVRVTVELEDEDTP